MITVSQYCDFDANELYRITDFDRYNNPFEQKYSVKSKDLKIFEQMETFVEPLSAIFGVQLSVDQDRHFAGVFRYDKTDYLRAHVDAGVHPNGLGKRVTLLWYPGGGTPLEFWMGDQYKITEPWFHVVPKKNLLFAFENTPYAWHSVSPNRKSHVPRYVATVSFLSDEVIYERKKAYFAPIPDEPWTPNLYKLRDLRAEQGYAYSSGNDIHSTRRYR